MDKESNILRLNEITTNIREDIKGLEKKEESTHDMLLGAMVKQKNNNSEVHTKLEETNRVLEDKTSKLLEKIRNIEGPDYIELDDKDTKFMPDMAQAKNFREIIRGVNITSRLINEQVEKIQVKVDGQANDIFSKIKKELGGIINIYF